MAGQASVLDESFVVNQTNGVFRYRAVVQGPNDQECAYATTAGAGKFLGITQEDKDDNYTANVRMMGISYASAMGVIAAGADVAIGNTTGQIADASTLTTPVVIGKALTTASAANDQILIFIKP